MDTSNMELGSGVSSPPTESLNGLKFGQKIYFEDVSAGAPTKASGSGSGSGRKVQSGQPPRCQVEGCKVDLSDAKAYYSRHKVCSMHSKSPMVIVAGLQQRFCQQCSRFHQLPEFDQGKRSCRRRLAGHNERRRKPPPGSLLASRYGRLSSSVFENSSRGGGYLVDFSTYPRPTGRDEWPMTRLSQGVPGNPQISVTARHLPHSLWQNPPQSDLFIAGGGSGFSSPGIRSGECFTGVTDSSCALSLLSNQQWASRNRASDLGVSELMHAQEASSSVTVGQQQALTMPLPRGAAAVNQFPNMLWGGYKGGNEGGSSSSSHEIMPNLGLGTMPHDQFAGGGLELSQQSRRHYMEIEQSREYDSSTQQMHWSL